MDRVVTVEGRELKLTHLEKRFWEPEGYTKLDVISYYSDIAKFILPHLRGRPESLKRHPDGAAGKSFFQKNMKDVPPWAETVTIEETRYLVSNDTAGLLYMANLGCIEINPWLSRVGSLGPAGLSRHGPRPAGGFVRGSDSDGEGGEGGVGRNRPAGLSEDLRGERASRVHSS